MTDLGRLVKLLACCAFFVAILVWNYQPATRDLSILALATVFVIAAAYELTMRQARPVWITVSSGVILAVAGIVYFTLARYAPLVEARGPLLPAHDTAPPSGCASPPASSLTMIIGPDRVTGEGSGPFTPIRIGTCPALTLERTKQGLVVNAFGFDADDNLVWRIQNNDFRQVIRGFLTGHRPDASTLSIADNEGQETLFIRYLNANAVRIRGRFTCGETSPVTITDDAVSIGAQHLAATHCAVTTPGAPPVISYSKH